MAIIRKYKALGEMVPRSKSGGGDFVRLEDYEALQIERDEIRAIKDSAIESVALLHAERVGLKIQLADSDHCYRQAHDTGVVVMRERDTLKTELTKARELLNTLFGASKEMLRIAGLANQGSKAYNRAIVNLHETVTKIAAHQSAPAAKGGE